MRLLTCAGLLLVTAASFIGTDHLLSTEDVYSRITHHLSRQSSEHSLLWEDHLPRHVTPNSYKLQLQPFLHEGYFRGQVEINLSCHEPTDTIVLHAHSDLQVMLADTAVHSLGARQEPGGRSSFRKMNHSHHYERISSSVTHRSITISKMKRELNRDWCEIVLDEKLKKGMIYTLKLEFTGNLTTGETGAFYRISYQDHDVEDLRWYMATELKSQNARRLFPCFDEPNFKANLQISIARPANLKAFSSMPLDTTEVIANLNGWEMDHFSATPPMAPQSLAVVILDPTSLQPASPMRMWGGVTVHGYAQAHLINAFESKMMYQIIRMLQIIEHYIGITFPLPELHVVAAPEFHKIGTGNYWGLITFCEGELETGIVNYQIMQALSTQWVGHMVTPHWRSSVDFSDGLAYYLTYIGLINIKKNTEYANMIDWGPAFSKRVYYMLSKISGADNHHSKEIQSARLCKMLNHTLTEKTFKAGLHNFIQDRAFRTYTEDDFFEALSHQTGLDDILPVSIRDIAKAWIRNEHFPVITVMRNYYMNRATIKQHTFIREWPYQTPDTTHTLWWVPIMYLSHANLDVNFLKTVTWMKEERQISIGNLPDGDSFIIVNPEDIGMFIVNYDHTNWDLLSQYLLESSSGIGQALVPADTRSKLLSDAVYLAVSGELDFPTALNMTLFMRHEKEMSVWKTLLMLYEDVCNELYDTPSTSVLHKFGAYIGYLLIPAYKTLQDDKAKGEGKLNMYDSLGTFLSLVGYEPALKKSRLDFHLLLKKNVLSENSLRTMCAVFRWSDKDWELGLLEALSSPASSKRRNLISQLVSCPRGPEKLDSILNIMLFDGNYTFLDEDIKNVFDSINDYYNFIKFISNNWEAIKIRFDTKSDIWNNIFGTATQNFKTQEGFNLVSQLYHHHKNELGSAKGIVERSLLTITENVNGQYNFVPHMEAWLDQHLPVLSAEGMLSGQLAYENML